MFRSSTPDYAERLASGVHRVVNARDRGRHEDVFELATRAELADLVRTRTTIDSSNVGAVAGPIPATDVALAYGKGGRVAPLLFTYPVESSIKPVSRESTRTEAAAPVAYGTAANESAISFVDSDEIPRRIPVTLPVTKGALTDANGALRPVLETFIYDDLFKALDNQILNGTNTGEDLAGVLTVSGTSSQAKGADSYPVQVAKAAETALNNGATTLDLVAHPTDVRKMTTDAAWYTMRDGLREMGVRSIVPTTLLTAGTAVLTDWSNLHLGVRSPFTIAASDSHNDLFAKGIITLLGEGRFTLAIVRRASIVKLTGL